MIFKELKQKVEDKVIKAKVDARYLYLDAKTFIEIHKGEIIALGAGAAAGAACFGMGYADGFIKGLNVGLDTCVKAFDVMLSASTKS